MNDADLEDMFKSSPPHADAEAFEQRVMHGLQIKLWLRQWLVVVAGFMGGVYALAQMIRMPNLTGSGGTVGSLHKAAVETDQTLRAGAELFDVLGRNLMRLMDSSAGYLTYMQTPAFFWVTFLVCLAIVGLYYAYSQEEMT